ncbi:hypothetical protein BCR35DRAFT_336379 [Leucosporidium creatinivorum]|uniref:Uncharacterized protein n=1 Tax=Leucosporidium creatinivorum TaxID=106004 RepID=A0A1Y2C6P9_9BASI|nr:hypothetical protein BCR35DRAFT_336379 [Leucosporidium creatinivorum]
MRSEDCVYPGIAPQERADTLSAARMEVERLTEVVETLQSKLNEERADSDEEEIEPIPFIGAEEGYSTSAPSTNVAPYPLPPHTLGRSSYLTTGAAYHRPTIPSQQPPTPAASSVFSYESFQSASYPHPAPHPPAPQTSLYPPHFPSYYPSPSFHSPPPSFHPLARPPPTQPQFHYALLPAPSSALSTPNQRLPTPYIPPPSLPVAHAPPLPGEEASPRRPAREAREGKEEEVWSWCSEEVGELERAVEEMGRREGGGR